MKNAILFNVDGDDSSGTDLGDNEIEDMLNDALPDDIRNRKKESQYDERFKTVLEGKYCYHNFLCNKVCNNMCA